MSRGVQQLGLATDDGHQPCLQLGRRLHAHHTQCQRVGGRLQGKDLGGTLGAVAEMLAVGLELVFRQGAEHVCRRVLRAPLALAGIRGKAHRAASAGPSWERSFCSPSRIRPLIVPIGVSSMVAISLWVNPP